MASKRVHFSETEAEEGPTSSKVSRNEATEKAEPEEEFAFKSDSDGVLDIRQIRAQEAGEVDEEEGVRFTAFNLEEEMEEGHFDMSGNFIFKKGTEIRDNWLDNVDWVEVKKKESGGDKEGEEEDSDEESEGSGPAADRIALYKRIVPLLSEGESVQRAIRRYGGKRPGKSGRQKKAAVSDGQEGDQEKMMELIGYADELVNDGEMDVYQFTTEKLNYLIKMAEKERDKYAVGGDGDMFSDCFDAEKKTETQAANGDDKKKSEEVMWEFRWKNDDNEEIQGPFPTSKMIEWEKDSYFEDVFVRKVGSDRFYPSKRIDFELYT